VFWLFEHGLDSIATFLRRLVDNSKARFPEAKKGDAMLLIICIFTLLVAAYVAFAVAAILKSQSATVGFLETELKEIRAAQRVRPAQIAYGWFDDGWPEEINEKQWRVPLANPTPHQGPDEYATRMWIAEYQSFLDPHARTDFLRQLFKQGAWMELELLDLIYADESPFVRAWAAAHLKTVFKDYADWENPRKIRDYEPLLLQDPYPIVRAALWSNPHCNQLPWSSWEVSATWKEQMQKMSQIERLALMRNPELPENYVVALLSTPSEKLNFSRDEQREILTAAAVNPNLVDGSRRHGRDYWVGGNPPLEQYGQMWGLCIANWMDTSDTSVPYVFFKYIQTTPKVKLATYNHLLQNINGTDHKGLREAVVESCNDPFLDKDVLKAAWNDPDEDCRKIARERVGKLTKVVGVS
jgi:hypothetical protein